ncbi:SURF1 family-domain-containing protein [Lasiosphaeria hispida]|uniref:SURF1-like protein n=1 Tax=Lasiosphaeria hispida TaxID=260671 RepID=A0AAJ0HVP0_9PEZI|nr:SURF1 family-domain-containing protein [Lasiosphaeria hispida]
MANGPVFLNCLLRPAATRRVTASIGRNAAQKWAAAPRQQPSTAARRPISTSPRRPKQAADEPGFTSIVDNPPELVRTGRRHGPGLIVLAIIPVAAFILGTWQVQRLKWKTELLAKCEDRIVRSPLPLPGRVDPDAIADFDYRRVHAAGRFRHDQEMLVGPRIHDGEQGYMVVTPLERDGDPDAKVLVNRGWISKKLADQRKRHPDALPRDEVRVEGLLRQPWKKNMFTPDNKPQTGEFYFPDVHQMAALTKSQPVWIEATMEPDLMQVLDFEHRGIPIGRPAEVNLRNNHAQYIFTW